MSSSSGLLDLLRQRMAAQPAGRALLSPRGDVLDFGGLAVLAQDLADALRGAALQGRPRLALALGEPFAMAACMVGAMPAAAVVPLSATAPLAELQRAVRDTRCSALVLDEAASRSLIEWAESQGLAVIGIREDSSSSSRFAFRVAATARREVGESAWGARADGDPVVLVLQTSGTTAKPKIVPLTSSQLGASALNVARHLALSPDDLSLNVMPLHHSHGVVGVLLSSMVAGASVAYLSRFEAAAFFATAQRLHPTWFSATPTIHVALLDWLQSRPPSEALPRLRFVRSTSAPLPATMVERLERAYGAPLVESFGMTEWSQIASNGLAAAERRVGTVGRATGVTIALRDPSGRIAELAGLGGAEASGELLIRGDGVCGCYEGDSQATAAAWCDGWFRTGDLARVDADGFVTITGRLKEIVNRGGEKISPREVEEALLAHPCVRDAGAFGVPHPTLGEDLLAAVALKPGAEATPAQLREHLFARIAADRVPTEVRIVDALPRSETGKLARARLAELATTAQSPAPASARAPSALERTLCGIFAEVLGGGAVGLEDNFFRLGGDSLTGMRAVIRINKEFGIRLRPAALFRFPSVDALAREVQRQLPPPPEADDLERHIASLSDDEVARLLEAEERSAGGRA